MYHIQWLVCECKEQPYKDSKALLQLPRLFIALRNAGAPHAARSVVKATTLLHKDYLTASPETQSTETPPSTDQAVVNVIAPQKLDEPQINQVVVFFIESWYRPRRD